MSKFLYGLEKQERLHCESPEDVVVELFDDLAEYPDEPLGEIADRISWPLRVFEYAPDRVRRQTFWFSRKQALDELISDAPANRQL